MSAPPAPSTSAPEHRAGFASLIGRPNVGKSDAAQPPARPEAGHRLPEAADHAEPDPRDPNAPGGPDRLRGHARAPSPAREARTVPGVDRGAGSGGGRRRHPRRRCDGARGHEHGGSVPGAPERRRARRAGAEQDRPRAREDEAPAAPRDLRRPSPLPGARAHLGQERDGRGPARGRGARAPPRRPGALPGRHGDRPARDVLRRRDDPGEALPGHAAGGAVRLRRPGGGARRAGAGGPALHSRRDLRRAPVPEGHRHRRGRGDAQAGRPGRAAGARGVLRGARYSSISGSACAGTGGRTTGPSASSATSGPPEARPRCRSSGPKGSSSRPGTWGSTTGSSRSTPGTTGGSRSSPGARAGSARASPGRSSCSPGAMRSASSARGARWCGSITSTSGSRSGGCATTSSASGRGRG